MNRMNALNAISAAVLLLSSAALSACGSAGDAAPSAVHASPAAASTSPSASPGNAPEASPAEVSPAPSPAATTSSEPSGTAAPSPDLSGKKTYRMNKNYDIVPIDADVTEKKVVLLTFDDGPKAEETLKPILDTLDKHGAKAIFFVNGYRVKAHPELLKEIDDRGQTVGNHSWDHIMLGKEKPDTIRKQIEDVQTIVQDVIGKKPTFFRPPFASGNDDTHATAKANGLLYMTWSNGSLDWEMTGSKIKDKTAAIVKNVTDQLHPGSNILMHELSWTGDALDTLLTTLEQKGYSFVDPAAIDTEQRA